MLFKERRFESQLEETPTLLQRMAMDIDDLSLNIAGVEMLVTRVSDPVPGESGVHPDKRAFDCRNEFPAGKFRYNPEQVTKIVDAMNAKYTRTDGKKTCIHHSFKGGPWHFHVQVAVIETVYPESVRLDFH